MRAGRSRVNDAQHPIIVVGCSRAGTTLVYKPLSESRKIGSLQRETRDYWACLHPLADTGVDVQSRGLLASGCVWRYNWSCKCFRQVN